MNEESDRVASRSKETTHRKGTRRLRTVSVTAAPMAVRVRTTQNYPKSAFAERTCFARSAVDTKIIWASTPTRCKHELTGNQPVSSQVWDHAQLHLVLKFNNAQSEGLGETKILGNRVRNYLLIKTKCASETWQNNIHLTRVNP